MPSLVPIVRQEWESGHRRFGELSADLARREALGAELEVVTDELRKRVGQTFTLAELAAVYDEAESWARPAVAERAAVRGWARDLSTVVDSAFHLYARGATDYAP